MRRKSWKKPLAGIRAWRRNTSFFSKAALSVILPGYEERLIDLNLGLRKLSLEGSGALRSPPVKTHPQQPQKIVKM